MIKEEHITLPLHDGKRFIIDNIYQQIYGNDVSIPYLQGAPGAGKTQIIEKIAKEYGWGFLSTHFPLHPIEELGGIPQFTKQEIDGKSLLGTIWSCPDIFVELYKLSEKYSKNNKENQIVIWLLDDMHLCGPSHNALLYPLLTNRKLRNYKLPKNVAIVMAGNTSNKAGTKTMFSAIVNRCFLLPVFADFDYWENNFAISNGVHLAIISFLKNEQNRMYFHEDEQVDTAWCSPRSWARLSNELISKENWSEGHLNSNDCMILFNGYIGHEAAIKFNTYYQIFSKFDIDKILKEYKTFKLPEKAVDKYALSYALVNNYIGRENRNKFAVDFSNIIVKISEEAKELALMIIRELINMEKIIKKRISNIILTEIQKISPELITDLLSEVNEA